MSTHVHTYTHMYESCPNYFLIVIIIIIYFDTCQRIEFVRSLASRLLSNNDCVLISNCVFIRARVRVSIIVHISQIKILFWGKRLCDLQTVNLAIDQWPMLVVPIHLRII